MVRRPGYESDGALGLRLAGQRQPYRAMLTAHGVAQSMSRKRECLDNAMIETFSGNQKAEYCDLATLECAT